MPYKERTVVSYRETTARITSISENSDNDLIITTKKNKYIVGPNSVGGNKEFRLGTTPIYEEGAMWIQE